MVKVKLPDGRIADFPDDMPREQIKAFVAQKYPNAYGEQSMPEFSPEALAQIEANNRAYDDKSHLGWNVAGDALSGAGEGVLSGMGRLASGVTFGASDWLDRKTGGNLAALDDRLQRRADAAGLGLANKIAKAGTEIVGNVAPSAAITRGLARAGVKSTLGQAAASAGVGGALYGASQSDTLSELPVNTIAGGVEGTIGGTVLHGAFNALGAVSGLLRSNVKKGMDYLRSKFGDAYVDDMIREAEQKGLSLAEVADDRALKAVQMARQQTSAADDIVTQNAQAIRDNVSNKNTDTLNDMFGIKSGYKMAQEAEQAAMDKARPMFQKLQEMGDLAQVQAQTAPTRAQLASYPAESNSISDFDNPLNYTLDEWLSQPRKINLGSKNISLNDYRARKGYPIPGDDVLDKMRMPHGMSGNDKRLLAQQYEKNRVLYDKSAQEYKDLSDKGELPTYDDIVDYAGGSETSDKKIAAAKMAWKKAQKQAENKQNLVNQLNTGNYADIPFGALPENVRQQVNQIRINNGEIPIDADMIIPANVVRKWRGNRLNENYSSDRVAQIADEVFHSPNVKVSEGNFPHIQKLIKERPEHTHDFYGFVSRDKNTGQTTAKTIYEKGRSSAGRQPASLQNENSAGRMRLSDLQTSSDTVNIPSLGEVVNSNNVINSAVKSVKGAYSSLKGLPDTDARVILETRKLLSSQTKSADKTLAYQAKQALKEFDDALPADFRKGLEEANKIYKDNYQFSEAKESASDIFKKNISPEEFSDKFGKMTAEEKQALRGGLRDELFSIIENRANETLGWNRVVPKAVQAKIRRVLGVKDGDKLIEYAQSQLKSMRNLNKILGGSNTAEKLDAKNTVSTAVEALGNPTGSVGIMLKRASWNNARNKGIARIMTNPSADLARSTYEQAISPQGWEAVYQALYNPRGLTKYGNALAAYLTGKTLEQ